MDTNASVVIVTGWLFAFTKETFLAKPSGYCPVQSILHFVDILLVPNTDKQLRSTAGFP